MDKIAMRSLTVQIVNADLLHRRILEMVEVEAGLVGEKNLSPLDRGVLFLLREMTGCMSLAKGYAIELDKAP